MDVVELVTRMGDTILDVEYLPATTKVIPERTHGLVTRTMRRTELAAPAVPCSAIDRRPLAYLGASLVALLVVVLVAFRVAPFERLPHRERARVARVAHVREPDPPPPKPAPPAPPAPAAIAAAPAADGPPDPDAAAAAAGFGGEGHHLDVDRIAPKETYKVTRWAVPTYFRKKGGLAPVPTIEWCDDDSCVIQGPLELHVILSELEQHHAEIAQCYREHTGDLEGQIRFRFEVSPEGTVTGTYGKPDGPVGYGTGAVGRCVAKLAARLHWP
jgi:hypothetical protein